VRNFVLEEGGASFGGAKANISINLFASVNKKSLNILLSSRRASLTVKAAAYGQYYANRRGR